jgi:quinoprotein glucose dehydrogenase
LTAVDLIDHKVLWSHPLGTIKNSGPLGIASRLPLEMGVPLHGGSITTASGLIFIGASQDRTIRAFEIATGKLLWEAQLPAGGHSTPTTYLSAASGRQFVVMPASGLPLLMSGQSDSVIAYALPKE